MKRCLLALFLLCPAFANAESAYEAAVMAPIFSLESDSDDFYARKRGAGFLFEYEDALHYSGVLAAKHHYSHNGWSIDAEHINLVNRAIDPQDGLGRDLKLGFSRIESHELLTADLGYSTALQEGTRAGVFLNRDWVETLFSLEDGVHYTYAGGSLEQNIGSRFTLIGLAAQQRFSDNNRRTHLRARAIYDVLPDYGINLQYRYRQYRNTDDRTVYYFNPDEYQEDMLAVGFRRKIQGWVVSGLAGYGQQKIDSDSRQSTHLYELGLDSPISSRLVLNTRFTKSDSASVTGPDYRYTMFQMGLIFAF